MVGHPQAYLNSCVLVNDHALILEFRPVAEINFLVGCQVIYALLCLNVKIHNGVGVDASIPWEGKPLLKSPAAELRFRCSQLPFCKINLV